MATNPEDIEFQRGSALSPTTQQLPYGQATELNEGLAMAEGAGPEFTPDTEAETAEPVFSTTPREPTFRPRNEVEEFLSDDLDDADPRIGPVQQGRLRPPSDVGDWLPLLQQAALDPSASPQVRALYEAITFHLGS